MTSDPTPTPGRVRWWAPGRADWQVAALFVIGSACFALGALPGYAGLVGVQADNWTYAIGSVFFTGAALLQFMISTGVIRPDVRPRAGVRWRGRVRRGDRPEWWAGAVQLAGTVLFNISTFSALNQNLDPSEAYDRVWRPDVYGSAAFLLASALVFADIRRPWLTWRPRDLDWSVGMLNMVGSIAFGVSAAGAKISGDGTLQNAALANAGTFVGACCFLAGAVLLIPEQAND